MSFAARLIHPLTLHIPGGESGSDDYGQPIHGPATTVELPGLVQPKSAREIAAVSEAGAEISDHTIFLLPRDIPLGSWFVDARGARLDVRGVRHFDFGRSPHLEIDARLVRSDELVAVGS